MREHDHYQRLAEIPAPIREVGDVNPLVRRLIECYAHGQIITQEEMLCQMVVMLAKDWNRNLEEARKFALTSMIPPFNAPAPVS